MAGVFDTTIGDVGYSIPDYENPYQLCRTDSIDQSQFFRSKAASKYGRNLLDAWYIRTLLLLCHDKESQICTSFLAEFARS